MELFPELFKEYFVPIASSMITVAKVKGMLCYEGHTCMNKDKHV